jgi:hypothetical protein
MANKDKDQDTRQVTKQDPADSEKRAKDLKPPKEKGKDVKGGGFRGN